MVAKSQRPLLWLGSADVNKWERGVLNAIKVLVAPTFKVKPHNMYPTSKPANESVTRPVHKIRRIAPRSMVALEKLLRR